jgi:hypothetical protein
MLESWQALQLPLTPVWIIAPVGAGVANAVPGAVFVAEAATKPPGTVPRWQVSQIVEEGMCEPAPAGLVAGMPTMRLMPANVVLLPAGWWQAAQLLLMPLWFISEPLNLAPLPTGVLAIDEPAPTWHSSHDAEVGMWLPGRPTMLKLFAAMANEAAAAPWHCAQLLLVLGALAWMLASVGNCLKSLVVWQPLHCAVVAMGM